VDTGDSQSKIIRQPPGGSIVIKSPTEEDDGVYQCFARNEFGSAITIETTVRRAGMTLLAVENLNYMKHYLTKRW